MIFFRKALDDIFPTPPLAALAFVFSCCGVIKLLKSVQGVWCRVLPTVPTEERYDKKIHSNKSPLLRTWAQHDYSVAHKSCACSGTISWCV